MLALLTLFGVRTITAISVVALYIIRIYKDVRGRPEYIVESSVGFSEVLGAAVGFGADVAVAPMGPRLSWENRPVKKP